MPIYWNKTIATDENPIWNFTNYKPDLIIIFLGSNDFFNEPYPSPSSFIESYISLLQQISNSYNLNSTSQTVKIINICGGNFSSDILPCPYISQAISQFQNQTSFPFVYFISIPFNLLNYPEDYGCLEHRNVKGQWILANYLFPQIKDIMNW